jgi:hypothetical protein
MSAAILLQKLIGRYVGLATEYAAQLRQELPCQDLLRAVNSGAVPREGILPSGARYRFHGVGCSIEDSTLSIDFDFGPDGRSDGFDAWRLQTFGEQLPEFAFICDLESIENGLEHLRKEGVVTQPHWPPSEHLFYLVPDENSTSSTIRG